LSRFHPFDDCLLKKLGVCCSLCKYLETLPKGKVKLQGSDASHAWVSVCLKWAGVNLIYKYNIRERHIVTAYGRDYSDISPLKFISSGEHKVKWKLM
jgi:transglutaminase-like putative cysteine protease